MFSHTFFPIFPRSLPNFLFLILSFICVDLRVSAREFEREDRRIQDAWMRKVVRREPVPCDSFMKSVSMAKTFLSVNGRRMAACSFCFFFVFMLFSFINRIVAVL